MTQGYKPGTALFTTQQYYIHLSNATESPAKKVTGTLKEYRLGNVQLYFYLLKD